MVDVVKQQARLRYRAKRLGYCLMQTRGIENWRREASGVGTFVLLGHDGVALSAATLRILLRFSRRTTGLNGAIYSRATLRRGAVETRQHPDGPALYRQCSPAAAAPSPVGEWRLRIRRSGWR